MLRQDKIMPSQKKRKQIHWEKVERRHEREAQRIESIVPQTIEAQVCKPLTTVDDSYEFIDRSPASSRNYLCTIQ